MTEKLEQRLKELEAKTDRSHEEENERVALLELDEKSEDLDAANKNLADVIANNPTPVPDPVVQAHDAVVAAKTAMDTAQKAYDDAAAAALAAAMPAVPAVN